MAISVPWLKPRRGRAAVGGFFESLAGLEFHKPNIVVVLVDVDVTVKTSGRRFSEDDEIHLWRFDAQGRASSGGTTGRVCLPLEHLARGPLVFVP